mgnify:CR=1 FL=1
MIYLIYTILMVLCSLAGLFGIFVVLVGLGNQDPTLLLQGIALLAGTFVFVKIIETVENSVQKNNANHHSRETNALLLSTNVKGVSHKNYDGSSRQIILTKLQNNSAIDLINDKNNQYDKNAVIVKSSHGTIGFLPKELSDVLFHLGFSFDTAYLVSKGNVSNGLLGCTIEFYAHQTNPKTISTPIKRPSFESHRAGKPKLMSEGSYFILEKSETTIDINIFESLSEETRTSIMKEVQDYSKYRYKERSKRLKHAINETRKVKKEISKFQQRLNEYDEKFIMLSKSDPKKANHLKEEIKNCYFSKKDLENTSLQKAYKKLDETKKKIEKEIKSEESEKQEHIKKFIEEEFIDYQKYRESCNNADNMEKKYASENAKATNLRLWRTLRSFEKRNAGSNTSRQTNLCRNDDDLDFSDISYADIYDYDDDFPKEDTDADIDTMSDYGYGEDLHWDDFR